MDRGRDISESRAPPAYNAMNETRLVKPAIATSSNM
jgi:hypothetical protein